MTHQAQHRVCQPQYGCDLLGRRGNGLVGVHRREIQYDTPYIKGLPINVTVDELNEHGEASRREVLSSFEDAYTVELKEMHGCFTEGRSFKTTAEDAMRDVELFERMFRQLEEQG